jgi:MFS family permease
LRPAKTDESKADDLTEPASRRAGVGKAALIALVLLTCLNLLNFIDRYILPGTQPLIQAEFHASDQAMGALTTALFITYMLTAPFTGWLGDRFRRKPLIVTGAVLWSLATLATYFVHDYWTLYFPMRWWGSVRLRLRFLRRRYCRIIIRRGSATGFCRSSTWRFRWGRRWGF